MRESPTQQLTHNGRVVDHHIDTRLWSAAPPSRRRSTTVSQLLRYPLAKEAGMHLYQLRLVNYRRFTDATINLDAKMVAILGPNESGKSSLLDALGLFNNENRVSVSHLRRGSDTSDSRVVGELTFRLTEDDRAKIPYHLPESDALWLKVRKRVGGVLDFDLFPPPSRPLEERVAAQAALAKANSAAWYRRMEADEEEDDENPLTILIGSLASELNTQVEQLPQGLRSEIQAAAQRLAGYLASSDHSATATKAINSLIAKLGAALDVEAFAPPKELAETIAGGRPRCILFDDDHRTLTFSHDLSDLSGLSAAFENLADLGGLHLPSLQAAIQADDSGERRTLLNRAVDEINRRLEEEWGQSNLKVDLDVLSLQDVRITVAGADGEQFDLTHRSDGMRMFLALCAFLAKEQQDPKPVLLIDELERHLHYEAQADIVSMFDARTDVSQVVYSTHSIGCLPQDLGRGVRTVIPDTNAGTSAIDNIWARDKPGVQPLVAAMGAATLPLQPSRPLVFGEGPCDALLLPALIREAIDEHPLDYLVVSGASAISKANFEDFDRAARRVVYLYDGDTGGNERRRFLRKDKGVPNERIVQLESGITLEDLIEPGLWIDACNRAITDIAHGAYAVTEKLNRSDIRAKQRVAALKEWCKQRDYRCPEKLKIAETILELMTGPDLRADRRWLDPKRRAGLVITHEVIAGKVNNDE
jgi:predicted ATP-dependent endonuclease of OLD family